MEIRLEVVIDGIWERWTGICLVLTTSLVVGKWQYGAVLTDQVTGDGSSTTQYVASEYNNRR